VAYESNEQNIFEIKFVCKQKLIFLILPSMPQELHHCYFVRLDRDINLKDEELLKFNLNQN